jgi:hypothetical protein
MHTIFLVQLQICTISNTKGRAPKVLSRITTISFPWECNTTTFWLRGLANPSLLNLDYISSLGFTHTLPKAIGKLRIKLNSIKNVSEGKVKSIHLTIWNYRDKSLEDAYRAAQTMPNTQNIYTIFTSVTRSTWLDLNTKEFHNVLQNSAPKTNIQITQVIYSSSYKICHTYEDYVKYASASIHLFCFIAFQLFSAILHVV